MLQQFALSKARLQVPNTALVFGVATHSMHDHGFWKEHATRKG